MDYSRKTISSLSLILILAMTVIIAFAQPGLAQIGVIQPERTSGYISAAPLLIGVGQPLTVNLWIFPLPTLPNDQPGFYGFKGISVTFVKPDGTKDTFMPTDGTGVYPAGQTQAMAALYFFYTPNMAGNWSLSFTMPAQSITDTVYTQDLGNSTQYTGCTSNTAYFTVQTGTVLAGLLNGYPWAALPNANVYWSYPINANNREWNAISGDWLGSALTVPTVNNPTQLRWQPYGSGPGTAHIVWTNQNREGGIIGGEYGSLNYIGGIVNSGQATGIVVMDGNVYTNIPNTTPVGQPVGQFRCINEATGQVMYQVNGSITYGIHLPGNTYQQSTAVSTSEGGLVTLPSSSGSLRLPYLWGSVTFNGSVYWNYYDPLTGALNIPTL